MSVAAADPKHNVQTVRQNFYDKISKQDMTPLWEVLRNVVTKEPKSKASAEGLEVRRDQEVHPRGRRADHAGGGRAPRAGAGEPDAARPEPHHQFAVRRHPAHHAGRGRRRAQARFVRHPLRAGRRGRLHRGRGREGQHVARRLHPDAELGAARSRQPVARIRCCGSTCSTCRPSITSRRRSWSTTTRRRRTPTARTATRWSAIGSGVLPDGQTSTRSSSAAR